MISESSTGNWAEVQLPCCTNKQGELPENMLQHLLHNLPPHTVLHVAYLGARFEYHDFLDQRGPILSGGAVVGWIGRVDDLEHATIGCADEQDVVGLAVGGGDLAVDSDLAKLDRMPGRIRDR